VVRACPRQHPANAGCLSLVHSSTTWAKLRRTGLSGVAPDRLTLENPRLTERIAARSDQDCAPRPIL
jgi:hypothetical protein